MASVTIRLHDLCCGFPYDNLSTPSTAGPPPSLCIPGIPPLPALSGDTAFFRLGLKRELEDGKPSSGDTPSLV